MKYGHLGEVESLGEQQTNGRNHASAVGRTAGGWGTATFAHTGMAVERGTGDELDGNLISRVQKRLERAQVETGGEGHSEEKEGASGREESCTGAAPL